ncbi:C40 family peptidase [Tenacibaculum retecalamus]|uniref:C40 family peptidase n=1 Tax=Tenacibaculum retecalamus TaxID=3018315 RepID=UPI0023D90A0A|nr:C40 family peptidase [Tenacibaculum retecalamus]WBX70769.1 C40 family peptidase [Tenacibaculum retecalamus]
MIKKSLFIVLLSFLMVSCGSSKNVSVYKKNKKIKNKQTPSTGKPTKADKIVWTAVTYKGVPYKYGGMSKRGMDCSGLIHTSFKQREVQIPRTSRAMYAKGYGISLREVQRGDLLFFSTSRKGGGVNHVGLVTSIKKGDIRFIHSTSSRGVIVTSLHENYWRKAFIKAKRVL